MLVDGTCPVSVTTGVEIGTGLGAASASGGGVGGAYGPWGSSDGAGVAIDEGAAGGGSGENWACGSIAPQANRGANAPWGSGIGGIVRASCASGWRTSRWRWMS